MFGLISGILTKHWDTLSSRPEPHKILLDGIKSNDADHISAVVLEAEFNAVRSKSNLHIGNENFYSSDADPSQTRPRLHHTRSGIDCLRRKTNDWVYGKGP